MKLTATREELLVPLQSVIGVVERRQTMRCWRSVCWLRGTSTERDRTDLEVEWWRPAR